MPRWTPAAIRTRMNARPRAPRNPSDSEAARDILLLLLLSALPYANTLFSDFVYDDVDQVTNNPYVHSFHHLREIFTSTVWSFQGAQGVTNYYRPLMTFGYLLCYKLFGPVPFGFHLVNLVWNAWVVCLVFAVARILLRDRRASLIAAGLFALHPIHTESVAWIAGVTDLELAAFYLLTFRLFLGLGPGQSAQHNWIRNRYARGAAMMASFAMALLSKEQALTLPAVAMVFEHAYREDRGETSLRTKLSRYVPLWTLAALYVGIRMAFLGSMAAVISRPNMTRKESLLSAVALIGQYFAKLIWPVHLSAFYIFTASNRLSDPRVLWGLAALAICAYVFLWLWRNARIVSFSVLWIGATLAPVLNARWMPASVFAERYLYLPSAGFCWLIGWAAMRAWENSEWPIFVRRMVPVALAIVVCAAAVATVERNRDWRNGTAFYESALANAPDSSLMRSNLGTLYFNGGNAAAAEREWTQALAEGPRNVFTLCNFGILRAQQGRYAESFQFFERAIRIRPDYMIAHLQYAQDLAVVGRDLEADWQYRLAVTLDPHSAEAHTDYGVFLVAHERPDDAQRQFLAAVREDPSDAAYDGLGDIYLRWNQMPQAEQSFRAALAIDSYDSRAHFGLAQTEAASGDNADAIEQYRAGLDTDPSNADALAALKRLGATP
jgi:protein O-mannosyl-transferase